MKRLKEIVAGHHLIADGAVSASSLKSRIVLSVRARIVRAGTVGARSSQSSRTASGWFASKRLAVSGSRSSSRIPEKLPASCAGLGPPEKASSPPSLSAPHTLEHEEPVSHGRTPR